MRIRHSRSPEPRLWRTPSFPEHVARDTSYWMDYRLVGVGSMHLSGPLRDRIVGITPISPASRSAKYEKAFIGPAHRLGLFYLFAYACAG